MSNLLNTLSAIGALVMAATPLAAIGSVAHAADYAPQQIRIGDLDFSRPADAAQFRHRVDIVADRMCGAGRDLTTGAACRTAVREEAMDQLGAAQRQDLHVAAE